jgi:hypothetical protein
MLIGCFAARSAIYDRRFDTRVDLPAIGTQIGFGIGASGAEQTSIRWAIAKQAVASRLGVR